MHPGADLISWQGLLCPLCRFVVVQVISTTCFRSFSLSNIKVVTHGQLRATSTVYSDTAEALAGELDLAARQIAPVLVSHGVSFSVLWVF